MTALAVMKRELKAYFYSPIAYAVMVIFLVISGYFFYSGMTFYGVASFDMSRMAQFTGQQELSLSDYVLRPLFGNMAVVLLLMAPLLTMRLFSEEKKSGSIELLFTWPIKDGELLVGKFLAAASVLAVMLAATCVYLGFVAYYAAIPWGEIAAGYLGLFLLGAAFISLGIFISTMTENQIISAAVTFGALLIFWLIGWTAGDKTDAFSETLKYLSILEHFDPFTKGLIDTRGIVYYLSFAFVFLFLTMRSLESNKWRG
ncbi:MAG: ABC transporter permease [Candidatus Nitrospinota bacterium M3_3B_026]